jgi:beta-glucosidase
MASYDTKSASYVLDSGKYVVRVGDSSRNTQVAAKLSLGRKLTTSVVNHEMNDARPAAELTSDPANFYTYPAEKRQLAAAPVIALKTTGFKTVDNRSAEEQNVPVPSTSPYAAIDGDTISSTTAYVSGNGYQAKTGEKVRKVTTNPKATLKDVAQGKLSLTRFVAGLDETQLANIVEGASAGGSVPQAIGAAGYTTSKYESLGIPAMVLSDGPAGLRLTQKVTGPPATYQYETAWPIGTQLAQTWDRDLVRKVGHAIGLEMKAAHVTLWLAPGMNIHRDPLNGRNFEYFSEDPLVSGLTSASETLGVQSNPGVGVTVKHFVANNQEANRNAVNELIGERALREIYLRGFQISVESAQPMAVMSSYNKVNGSYSSANYDLLTDLLRGEWGFQGLVMSDWGGSHNPVATMYAGNDLIEPGNNPTEILANLKKVTPDLDVTGLPVLTTSTYAAFGFTSNAWSLGGFTLDAAGAETISTTVDARTDLSKIQSAVTTVDASGNATTKPRGPYASVADAYADVQALLGGTALTAAQKAAITVTPTGTPVSAYTIALKGHYNEPYTMRLGDLQRSATRILTVIMHSQPFQDLTNVKVGAYSSEFRLSDVVTATKGKVK